MKHLIPMLLLGCPRSTPTEPAPVEPTPAAMPDTPPKPTLPLQTPAEPVPQGEAMKLTEATQLMSAFGKTIQVRGVPERHTYPVGGEGTALVLDLGPKLWVSQGEPPEGLVIGTPVTVEGELGQGPTPGGQRIRIPFLKDVRVIDDAP